MKQMFFWNSLAFSVIQQMLAIWSLVPLPFQIQLEHLGVLSSRTGLENFEYYFSSVWDESDCVVVWAFFGIAFFWVGMKTDLFQGNPLTLLVGMQTSTATMENSVEIP